MFNPAGLFEAHRRRHPPAPIPSALQAPLADPRHAKWQALVLDGQIVEGVREARDLGLDLPQALGLVNEFRAERGLLPKRRRWWWPFG